MSSVNSVHLQLAGIRVLNLFKCYSQRILGHPVWEMHFMIRVIHFNGVFVYADNVLKIQPEDDGGVVEKFHMDVAQDMLNGANHDPNFIKAIITGDEIMVYLCTR